MGLISLVLLERIRDGGHSVPELMEIGERLLGKREVMPGVAPMVRNVHVEGTFPDGTKLMALRSPIRQEKGDLERALYGSFLPVPDPPLFEEAPLPACAAPSETVCADGALILNEGRKTVELDVTNTDRRAIQIGSHFRFIEAAPVSPSTAPPLTGCA